MRFHPVPGALLLTFPFLLAAPLELEFAPEEDLSLSVSYEMVHESELTDLEQVTIFNDEENEVEVADIEIVRKTVEHVSFTDDFLEVDDGRAVKVERMYDELTMVSTEEWVDAEGESGENLDEGESVLVGSAVLFRWDEDDEEYVKSFVDEDEGLDEDLLEKLEFTGHLIECLTDKDLEEGDTWELDVETFGIMVVPGGDHSVIMESDPDGEQDEYDEEYRRQFDENLDGEIVAEYKGTRDEDGVEVAVIGLTVELTTEVEMEEDVNVNFDINGETQEGDGTNTRTFETGYELEGELLWNIAGGHAFSFELAGDTELEMVVSFKAEVGDFSMENRTTRTFEGTVTHRIEYD
jgi:hypothetical protein